MVLKIGFYSHGQQAGYVGYVTTEAGTCFIGTNGKMSRLY